MNEYVANRERQWFVNRTNQEFLQHLSQQASISPIFAQILINRGLKDSSSIRDFLNPSLDNLHDPFLLPDMEAAVRRVRDAVMRRETVIVHGDYDADGITSSSLMISTLRGLGLKTCYYIPNRITEGYGLSGRGIEAANRCSATLLITVDCGMGSHEEVQKARSSGIDVIITDHHEPPEELPEALAVINPHRSDSVYPFKYLAGVGVAFKLAQALDPERVPVELLDLVAIGTVADSVPLVGENRILVSRGLKELQSGKRVGIRALKEYSNIGSDLRSGILSYTLIPRINAAGRLDDASGVVDLFLTQERVRAERLAAVLEGQNRERQKLGEYVFRSALKMIDDDNPDSAIVLASSDWHQGVIGIAASRLVEIFFRPVFLFSVNGDFAKGSSRSIPSFHLFRGISECRDLLTGFGGHSQAAGLKIETGNLSAFRERINSVAEKALGGHRVKPVIEIDAGVTLSDVSFELLRDFDSLEPFGESNREPVLGSRGVDVMEYRVVGNNHLKMKLRQNGRHMDSIGFGMGGLSKSLHVNHTVDIAFVPKINEWNGSRNLQLTLKAIRWSRREDDVIS
jgi:single-stranded-DNA-specific exonuclease